MAERKLYFYDLDGYETNSSMFEAILTTSLSQFPHIDGCCSSKNIHLLVPENVGKKFKLLILDPFEIGEVTYFGDGIGTIPDEEIKYKLSGINDYIDKWFYVFQTPDNELIICSSFDVKPLF